MNDADMLCVSNVADAHGAVGFVFGASACSLTQLSQPMGADKILAAQAQVSPEDEKFEVEINSIIEKAHHCPACKHNLSDS